MNELNDFFKALSEAKANDPKRKLIADVRESVKSDVSSFLDQLSAIEEHTPIVEEVIQPPIEEHIIEAVEDTVKTPEEAQDGVEKYLRALPPSSHSFQQPIEQPISPEMKAITDKLKFLEQWVGKISAAGPGGGAGQIYELDMPTKLVTGDYTINRKDYYIGVSCDVKSYITLPVPGRGLKNGRVVVIKDESGHAQLTPIKIVGTIDNDPDGAEIRINNGAIQLIYRDGSWRII